MNVFEKILIKKPKKSVFNMSHENKLTMDMGKLVPFMCEEVLPGDTWQVNTEMFIRFAPLVAPIMHRVNVKSYYFFVPFRLIWEDWRDFITGGEDGEFTAVPPYITISNAAFPKSDAYLNSLVSNGSLMDYLGFPTKKSTDTLGTSYKVSALPFRAYNLIWNEYFRNQNLQNARDIHMNSGEDIHPEGLMDLFNKNWEKDYFTSALPWTQRGPKVPIPLSGELAVKYKTGVQPTSIAHESATGSPISNAEGFVTDSNGHVYDDQGNMVTWDSSSSYKVPINSDAITSNINDLRTAYRLQRWLENNARAGSRYIEQILSHFGVRSSDARLQRPEFLGGGQSPVVISEVLQNSETATTPQGTMAGHGVSVGKTHKFKKYFEEHGFIIGIMCVLPRTAYQDGFRKQFIREDKFDYYFPEFAQLGEQAIENRELYFDPTGASAPDTGTFGYQHRYAEYRYIPSSVHGDFKDSLSFWHLGRQFNQQPVLNSSFVTAVPRNNVFAVQSGVHHLWVQLYNDVKAKRAMPKFAIPS